MWNSFLGLWTSADDVQSDGRLPAQISSQETEDAEFFWCHSAGGETLFWLCQQKKWVLYEQQCLLSNILGCVYSLWISERATLLWWLWWLSMWSLPAKRWRELRTRRWVILALTHKTFCGNRDSCGTFSISICSPFVSWCQCSCIVAHGHASWVVFSFLSACFSGSQYFHYLSTLTFWLTPRQLSQMEVSSWGKRVCFIVQKKQRKWSSACLHGW